MISDPKPNLTIVGTRLRPQSIPGHNIYFSILIQPYCPTGHQSAVLPEQGRVVLPSGWKLKLIWSKVFSLYILTHLSSLRGLKRASSTFTFSPCLYCFYIQNKKEEKSTVTRKANLLHTKENEMLVLRRKKTGILVDCVLLHPVS